MRSMFIILALFAVGCLARSPMTGPCHAKLREVQDRVNASPGLTGWEYPRCDNSGYFLGMQFIGSVAYCVTNTGEEIPKYQVNRWETGPDMHCRCAREEYEYIQTRLIGKTFRCADNGNYDTIGCTGSMCYCQDQMGQQVGESVHITQQNALNC